jgi:hypothetical protein
MTLFDGGEHVPHVEPVHVDVVGAEAAQAGVERLDHVLAMAAAAVGIAGAGVDGVLGGQHPPGPLGGDQLAGDLLAGAVGVGVGGVDEVAAGLGEGLQDAGALVLGGAPSPLRTEGHGAEAELRDS